MQIQKMGGVEKKTGLKKSSVYQMGNDGFFPKPIKLGSRASGWIDAEVDLWLKIQVAKNRLSKLDFQRWADELIEKLSAGGNKIESWVMNCLDKKMDAVS
jgi:predicted DNA-binding transcriptional regulator AlpA